MNPYPGLRPFRAEEARFFAGREVVLRHVQMRVESAPLTVLFARSGIGKSSFLTCRFMPSLAGKRRVLHINEWGSQAPSQLLEQKLALLQQDTDTFSEKPLLILDQFEDVFKLAYDRVALWETLAELVNVQEPQVHVLVSMREEWLGAWGDVAEYLPDVLNTTVRLAPLSRAELLRAITRPASLEGTITVESGLAESIVDDLKSPNAYGLGEEFVEVGLVQLVCMQLWAAAAAGDKVMSHALYAKAGRADTLIRDYVWKELGTAGQEGRMFSAEDRVVWSGLTRHLILAPGVKAMLTSDSLLRKIRLVDLGIAGPAVIASVGGSPGLKYLESVPEKRADPPPRLKALVESILSKSTHVGFLKEQRAAMGKGSLYELSHDALAGIMQQFSVEFERWVARRVGFFAGAAVFGLLVAPWLVYLAITEGLMQILVSIAIGVVVGIVYVGMIWVFFKLGIFIWRLIAFPVIRRLIRGAVPIKPRARAQALPAGKTS